MESLGTGAWFYLMINLIKLPFSHHSGLITSETVRFNARLRPAFAGALLGRGRWR